MKAAILAFPFLALAGCAGNSRLSLLDDPLYAAMGGPPAWQAEVGREAIALRFGDGPVARYPRTAMAGLKHWQGGDGTAVVSLEARPGPCEGSGGLIFEDHVRVRLSGREMTGCGGRLLRGRRR